MSLSILESAVRLAREGQPVALITLVRSTSSTPREAGAHMLVRGDGGIEGTVGGGRLEAWAMGVARRVLVDGAARLEEVDLGALDMECGGSVAIWVERLAAPHRLLLFGAGHVGREVSLVCARLGYAVHVVDDRAEWASRERFPEAAEVVVAPFAEAIDRLGVRPTDRVVIATRGHTHDQEVLARCAGRGAAYVGMIGSRTKVAVLLGELRRQGVPEEALAAVRTPIGLDIGGSSPAEIAVSVAAEIVALSHGRDVIRPMSRKEVP